MGVRKASGAVCGYDSSSITRAKPGHPRSRDIRVMITCKGVGHQGPVFMHANGLATTSAVCRLIVVVSYAN